ncbi:MAG: EF-P beta-lysylation protein EpmB [Planctomycetota bacterium]|nr:EF-P beta-lysylation protein EpmB [Planctomycetota bacterium]MDA1214042.1 EF-P beta-lysylation protein EpmB [Planctomycetota bacterium]
MDILGDNYEIAAADHDPSDQTGLFADVDVEVDWHHSLALAVRSSDVLLSAVGLPLDTHSTGDRGKCQFPVFVSRSYIRRMTPGDANDPLLRQVLASDSELTSSEGFTADAVGDGSSRLTPGLLKKYEGRALLIATGTCAIHCRYCFRREYPYGREPRQMSEWEPALQEIETDRSIHEIILSGGDPLMLTDARLTELCKRLDSIHHVCRLRFHSRLPIVLPNRVTDRLIELFSQLRSKVIVVVHANHPREIERDCPPALQRLVRAGFPVLNQAVLLKGVNDDVDVLTDLCERLINLGVMPYYLHQLDRVNGTSHFEVPIEMGRQLVAGLRGRLPGYAVPQYVQEIAGAPSKMPL